MSHSFRVTDIVESNNFQLIWIHIADCFQHLTTNASKSVNTLLLSFQPPKLKFIVMKITNDFITDKIVEERDGSLIYFQRSSVFLKQLNEC